MAGWEEVRWDWTEADSKKAYGDELEPFSGQYQNPGNLVRFYIKRRYIGGGEYSVLFPVGRGTGELSGVYVRPVRYPGGTAADFAALEKQMTAQYGRARNDDLDSVIGKRIRRVWTFPTTTIKLNFYNDGDLSIIYKPTREETLP
ncbi:MAG: hypothetical protein FJX76_09390 [Armatimonadetes bacterium]|nr:hypothetical protein [Armatimonadota bacterium]